MAVSKTGDTHICFYSPSGLFSFWAFTSFPLRPTFASGLIARFGAPAYKVAFAVASLAGLAVIVLGYHKLQMNPGKNVFLGEPPVWLNHVSWLLMLPAMIALVAAYVPSRIHTALKHPMLVAIKIWALAHLLVNWDLGSFLLFGSFLAYGVYDRISVKKRGASGSTRREAGRRRRRYHRPRGRHRSLRLHAPLWPRVADRQTAAAGLA